jgi:DNA polymerase V
LLYLSKNIVHRVERESGIPVSLGIGRTKTLAKAANYIAKKESRWDGVFNITEANRHRILASIPVDEVWGIGRQSATKLKDLGITNTYHLSQQDPLFFKKKFNKVLASIILELRGIAILNLEEDLKPKKQIMRSRSFGKVVNDYHELRQALTTHTVKALEELRSQKSIARAICIFLQTSRFSDFFQAYHHEMVMKLPVATDNTEQFLRAIAKGLCTIYQKNVNYKKAGIILTEISQKTCFQMDLFAYEDKKTQRRMELLDQINRKLGTGTLRYASEGFKHAWQMRSGYRSPSYTTLWSELPRVE